MSPGRVFITGGASGLGAAIAQRFAAAGARVCIGDVDSALGEQTRKLLEGKPQQAHFLYCDVTNEQDLKAAADWLRDHWGGVDLVVNNAGVSQLGPINDTSLTDWKWAIDINLLGVVRGCRAFVPLMQTQGGGTILNIASMAGLVHLPGAGAYNATKAAVVALSETLELELAEHGIKVCVACPSFFRSNLGQNMRAVDAQSQEIGRRLVDRARLSADDIACLIVKGLARGEMHILPQKEGRSAWRMKRLLPHALWLRTLRKQLQKLNARFQR
ncbi:SDR family oxidoreductase [Pseudomonas yamanorum]|uniref:SDR family oxidoreductase n=1 Tax=Pseudomonas yamanorum TaxID=515393 RepID=A0A7Y8FEB3_9PSED|nr:SDR family oxidoreductase [Pseudomonas yamanorum]NWE77797.1 SDR family oxidoreductase [Pseudomonas yamanorum]